MLFRRRAALLLFGCAAWPASALAASPPLPGDASPPLSLLAQAAGDPSPPAPPPERSSPDDTGGDDAGGDDADAAPSAPVSPAGPPTSSEPLESPAETSDTPLQTQPAAAPVEATGVPSTPEGAEAPPTAPTTGPSEATAAEDPEPSAALSEAELNAIAEAIGANTEAEDDKASAARSPASAPAPTAAQQLGQATARMLQSMNPDMSFILDVAAAYFTPGMSIPALSAAPGAGNYQLGAHDPSRTGFNLQQLEMFVAASVDPFFRMQANLVFSKFGVEVEEAFATSTSLPWGIQARAGQFLTRFGRKNPTHPHSWSFLDQPLVNGKLFGAEGNRGVGGELSWLAPLPWYLEVFGSVNEANDACCARSYFGGDVLPVLSPLDLLATGGVKQFFPLGDSLSVFWGVTGQSGPNPTGKNNRTEMVGTDVYVRYRPVGSPGRTAISWTTELIGRRMQIPGSVLTDGGFYSQVVAQFLLQYELGARIEGVSGNIGDPLDPRWTGVRTRVSAQATYYPSHFSRVRAQVAYGAQGDATQAAWLQPVNRPVLALFLAFEFLVGAHGSHGF